jgi:hypothetical protein
VDSLSPNHGNTNGVKPYKNNNILLTFADKRLTASPQVLSKAIHIAPQTGLWDTVTLTLDVINYTYKFISSTIPATYVAPVVVDDATDVVNLTFADGSTFFLPIEGLATSGTNKEGYNVGKFDSYLFLRMRSIE